MIVTEPIELLDYPEYGPADSDSSGPESTDSEPDSEDEAFIEDDGPFEPGLLTLLRAPTPPDDSDGSYDSEAADKDDSASLATAPQTTAKGTEPKYNLIDLTASEGIVSPDGDHEPGPMDTAEDLIEASQSLEWDDYCDSSPPNKKARVSH